MGFYDNRIKRLMRKSPRLVVLAINSIFDKNYNENTEVRFLDKELPDEDTNDSTYMDMLLGLLDDEFHWEFQLAEGHISIRMFKYGVRETLRRLDAANESDKYELHVDMPEQVVVFMAGANKKDEITVVMRLPDRQTVTYKLPCISAAVSVDSLIEDKLYMLIPFQQVQLNDRMNRISECSEKTKKKIAREIYDYRMQVNTVLEKLKKDGTITSPEYEVLTDTFNDVEKYLRDKDNEVDKVVNDMGDENYIPWSERIRAEGRAEGRAEKEKEIAEKLVEKEKKLAEKDEKIRELEKQLAELKK